MLFAECHGKLGRDGSRAHDRAEDLLTSTAFQLLRYVPLEDGLLAVLKRVRAVSADGRTTTEPPPWLNLNSVTEAKYEFWPRWGKYGEPDVVVELFAGMQSLGGLVIEVKLEASKSGEADDVDSEDSVEEAEEVAVADPDQLRRYWQGLRVSAAGPALGVVYLTSHAAPPTEELAASVAREPGNWLGWLSWRDVWSAMHTARCPDPAADLAEILGAKGLRYFEGFSRPEQPPPAEAGGFWDRQWFVKWNRPTTPLPVRGFWNQGETNAS